jgi:MFS family permease
VFSISVFIAGSIACALAPTMLTLALARGLQGVGGAGVFALTQTIIGDVVPPRERPKYQVYTSVVWMMANLAGPVLGGVFAEYTHWSMIFWINVPIGLVALFVINSRLKRIPRYERPHKLDLLGAALMIAASGGLLLALSWGGAQYAWASPQMIALIAASALAWGLLVWRQATAAEPLIPLSVLRNTVARNATLTMFFAMAGYLAMTIYLPIHLQTLGGMSASQSGLGLIPLMVFTSLGAWVASRTLHRTARYKRLPMAGLLASALCLVAMAIWPRMPFLALMGVTTVIAIGVGTLFPVVNVCVQAATPRHELGSTMALSYFMRSLGASLAIALFGSIILGGSGLGAEAIAHAGLPPGLDVAALAGRFSLAYAIGAASFLAAAVFFLIMEERPLFGERPGEPA